jgi:hypothetical protein
LLLEQFMYQEPGTAEEIAEFVRAKHGIVSGEGIWNIMYAPPSAVERRENNLKRFKEYYLEAKARIWP